MSPQAHRRGPKPNPDRGQNTGYRATARQRFELQMAGPFIGSANLQETIDTAVGEFLDRMRQVPGYAAALLAAENSQRTRAGVRDINSDEASGDD
ncbi:hypothetical protein HMPREF0591_2978 [Mycobacterium parascrofulaceum ATCC BAA-614]|uniref:Uncharacterized protein n=1 Tax=Mycobacterium parascrofulaceum ATCC BAA-614 TaxID=525368 RepID=D5P9Y4_9MYCO|nr:MULTISPECIES: hypothetical protein [Mycobacterium]EFG77110.1 hypothetical protein HMPREF0591_2978 [Mycobacterium parascrofulaceum ATCC BAA-614]